MIVAYVNPDEGFPPVYRVAGGVELEASSLSALFVALAGKRQDRETIRVYSASLEWVWWAAQGEGWTPAIEVRPGKGIASCRVAAGVELRSVDPLIPSDQVEPLRRMDAADGARLVGRALRAVCLATGQEAAAGIGSACSRAMFYGRALGIRPLWRHRQVDDVVNRACWAAYHGGLCAVWRPGLIALEGQDGGEWWQTDPERLGSGWTLAEIDRSSAYGADASRPLPDTRLPTVARADAEGGAIVDATIDLGDGGTFGALGVPVRVHVPGHGARIFPMRSGRWRGAWTSEMLAWAELHQAKVQIHRAWGWRSSDRFMVAFMDSLYNRKAAAEPGSIERSIYSACMQRAIGRLGRRPRATVTLTGEAAANEMQNFESWGQKYTRIYAQTSDLFVADRIPSGEVDADVIPPWPAFVVSRAWIALCDRVRAEQEAGMVALYSDTDSICGAWPPGCAPAEDDAGAGGWRVKSTPGWVDHRGQKRYLRGNDASVTDWAAAGVASGQALQYFSGANYERRPRSVLETAQLGENQLKKMLEVWLERRKRA